MQSNYKKGDIDLWIGGEHRENIKKAYWNAWNGIVHDLGRSGAVMISWYNEII